MKRLSPRWTGARCAFTGLALLLTPVASRAATAGAELYQQHCALCHGANGQGLPGVFPPLVASDFLKTHREQALRAPLEGLSGKIEVNGTTYEGAMPPVALDDEQLAAVYEHVYSQFKNSGDSPKSDEIAQLRAKSKYPTVAALLAATGGGQLPPAPEGWDLRVGVELSFSPARLAAHPDGEHVLILAENGDVWTSKLDGSDLARLFERKAYLDPKYGSGSVLGITVDRAQRLYLTSNQRDESRSPVTNTVTVYRSSPWSASQSWGQPAPWFRTSYPWGIGPYNHGVSNIAQGPDGLMYVNSGSRTDGGEAGTTPNYSKAGEAPITACIWRLDPKMDEPKLEIFARGLRNSFGFCWDADGRMIATENGPDAHAPEEINVIEEGKHYGFPFQFADWTRKAYPHTPDLPPGLKITQPLRNIGPDGGGNSKGIATLDPHSCPSGIVWLEPDWPAPLGGSFVTARFGNLLELQSDVGFDVIQLKPNFAVRTTSVRRLLAPLGRPVDVLKMPGHRLVIAEYSRGTSLAAGLGTPGRLLVLSQKRPMPDTVPTTATNP